MSYDVRILEWPSHLPQPENLDQVASVMHAMQEEKPGVNPQYVALGQTLIDKYPGTDMFADDDPRAADATVWPDNPLEAAQTAGNGVWLLSLPSEDRVPVLRHLVDSAQALQLVVLDEQLPMAWLPSGQVFPAAATELWEGLKDDMDTAPPVKPRHRCASW